MTCFIEYNPTRAPAVRATTTPPASKERAGMVTLKGLLMSMKARGSRHVYTQLNLRPLVILKALKYPDLIDDIYGVPPSLGDEVARVIGAVNALVYGTADNANK